METNWQGGLQLQWGAQAEFPSVVRLFELDCWGIPLAAAEEEEEEEGRRHLRSSGSCGCWPGFGNGRGPGRSALHR